MCVAMSQSYIGYDLENALQEELRQRNISKSRHHHSHSSGRG